MKNNGRNRTLHIIAAALAVAVIASALTLLLTRRTLGGAVLLTAEEYKKYNEIIVLDEILDRVEDEFYSDVPDRETMIAGAANGILSTLNDAYAHYYTEEEYEEYLSSVNGEYYGIGLLIAQPDSVGSEVLEVYEGYPGAKAGVQVGDIITHVDGAATANMPLDEVKAIITEKKNKEIKLTILRDEETLELSLKAENVTVKHVEGRLLKQDTGYITISMFTGNCAAEFESALNELLNKGMRSLVIDIRNNPGGSLDAVVDVADMLLGKGMRIVSVGPADSRDEEVYTARGSGLDIPIAVIVNENSASASEILAAAIQENHVGAVVGTTTYGKGIVQTTMYVEESGGWLKLTTDAYYTPNGNNIHGVGVTPDIYAELPEEYRGAAVSAIDQAEDAQLWAALNYVREKAG